MKFLMLQFKKLLLKNVSGIIAEPINNFQRFALQSNWRFYMKRFIIATAIFNLPDTAYRLHKQDPYQR